MSKTWTELCNLINVFKGGFDSKEQEIKEKYKLKFKELKEQEQEEIRKEKEKINKIINKKNYNLEENTYLLAAEVAFEIGNKVIVKRNKRKSFFNFEPNNFTIGKTYEFELKLTDPREGVFYFVGKDNNGKVEYIFPPAFAVCFDVIEVVEEYDGDKRPVA